MVASALGMRLVSSSVSMRSEFQIIERSVTLMSAIRSAIAFTFAQPSASALSVRKTAASSCIAFCIASRSSAVGVPPSAWRSRSKRSTAASTEAAFSGRFGVARSTTSPARIAAARPKTTRSMRLFDPSRLAPCTLAQPASPTAISPGWMRSGFFSVGTSASPQ